MKKNRFRAALSAVVLAGLVFTSCSKDDDMKPSTGSMRTLTVENIDRALALSLRQGKGRP